MYCSFEGKKRLNYAFKGLRALRDCVDAILIANSENLFDEDGEIKLSEGHAKIDEQRIVVTRLKTKYPQGAERQLIYATTKRKIDSTKLPADVGCVVNNVDSIVAIYNAVINRKPLMERIVTITGEAINHPQNMRVHIGTNYKELIDAAGGFKEEPVKIISGGPMMGFGVFELDLPTTKTASALLCLTKDEVSEMEPSACINCGRCLEACPGNIMPNKLATLAINHKEEEFVANDGMECCECGCCSYVCPAKRHLTQSIKSMRKTCEKIKVDAEYRWFLGIPFGHETPHFSTFSKNYERRFKDFELPCTFFKLS